MRTIWDGLDFSYFLGILLGLIPSLICITLHELSHGLAACALGDDTARRAGRLTLNPLKHLDPMGMLMMLVFRFGWAKPVPVNMYRFRNPKRGMTLTALAGPASNVVIAFVFLLLYGALYIPLQGGAAGNYLLQMLELTAYISLGFALFNLIPIPPLDGSKVAFSLLSNAAYAKLMRYERYGGLALFLLVSSGLLGRPLSAAVQGLFHNLLPVAQWACDRVYSLFYK